MSLNEFLFYYFIFINAFSFLGLILRKKGEETPSFNEKKFYKICPCKRMAESGTLSLICMYSAMGGFLYSSSSISLIGFMELYLNLILVLSLLCAFLGWKLKLE